MMTLKEQDKLFRGLLQEVEEDIEVFEQFEKDYKKGNADFKIIQKNEKMLKESKIIKRYLKKMITRCGQG